MKYIAKHAKRSNAKKYIINSITAIMVVLFFLSLCAVDSPSYIPLIIMVISLGWICLYAWANLS